MDELNVVLGIVVGVLTILGFLSGSFKWLWGKVSRKLSRDENSIPNRTLVILPNANPNQCWWHMGETQGKPAMQITGRFTVTNISKFHIRPMVAKLKKRGIYGNVSVKEQSSNYYGNYPIPYGCLSEVSVDIWIEPPFLEEGESLTSDLALVDQFGNEHWVKKITFRYA